MNELDLSNTQAVFVSVVLIGILLYLNKVSCNYGFAGKTSVGFRD